MLKENLIFRGIYEAGYAIGVAEARQKYTAQKLYLLLREKFGQLPKWVSPALQKSSVIELEKGLVRLVNAATWEEVVPNLKTALTKKKQNLTRWEQWLETVVAKKKQKAKGKAR